MVVWVVGNTFPGQGDVMEMEVEDLMFWWAGAIKLKEARWLLNM
jgi:hypothetical protein